MKMCYFAYYTAREGTCLYVLLLFKTLKLIIYQIWIILQFLYHCDLINLKQIKSLGMISFFLRISYSMVYTDHNCGSQMVWVAYQLLMFLFMPYLMNNACYYY